MSLCACAIDKDSSLFPTVAGIVGNPIKDVKFWDPLTVMYLLLVRFHGMQNYQRTSIKSQSVLQSVAFVSAPWRIPQRVRYATSAGICFVPLWKMASQVNDHLKERKLQISCWAFIHHLCPVPTLFPGRAVFVAHNGPALEIWSGFLMGCCRRRCQDRQAQEGPGWQIVSINWIFMAFDE